MSLPSVVPSSLKKTAKLFLLVIRSYCVDWSVDWTTYN